MAAVMPALSRLLAVTGVPALPRKRWRRWRGTLRLRRTGVRSGVDSCLRRKRGRRSRLRASIGRVWRIAGCARPMDDVRTVRTAGRRACGIL